MRAQTRTGTQTHINSWSGGRSGSCVASSSSPGHSALLLRHGRRQVDGVVPLRSDALLSLSPHRGFPPRGRSRPVECWLFFRGICAGGVKVEWLRCLKRSFDSEAAEFALRRKVLRCSVALSQLLYAGGIAKLGKGV